MSQTPSKPRISSRVVSFLWDCWCVGTVVGIWPRFIEPRLLATTRLDVEIEGLSPELDGFKVVQFSDLHIHPGVPDTFLSKLTRKINALDPDILVFTGDFLPSSVLNDRSRLTRLLNTLKARHGCFAVLGNHDYDRYVCVSEDGHYDTRQRKYSSIVTGLSRLVNKPNLTGVVTSRAKAATPHRELSAILDDSPFQLLHNTTRQVSVGGCSLNVCGLGEHMAGQCQPKAAFTNYDTRHPGIILVHNPDAIPNLARYPGDVLLCGHSHGGAVMLPWIWKRVTLLENLEFTRGVIKVDKDKTAYVNRGVGGTIPFRWFSMPEILSLTLRTSP